MSTVILVVHDTSESALIVIDCSANPPSSMEAVQGVCGTLIISTLVQM